MLNDQAPLMCLLWRLVLTPAACKYVTSGSIYFTTDLIPLIPLRCIVQVDRQKIIDRPIIVKLLEPRMHLPCLMFVSIWISEGGYYEPLELSC